MENLQKKLAEIKDRQKQRQAQQITNQFDHINKVWTDHFMKQLARYDTVLQKIQLRTNKASANGKDVADVNAAIQTAKAAISTARVAVTAQAQKTYVANATTISSATASPDTSSGQGQLMQNLRSSFKTLRNQLFNDLFALRDGAMKNAKNAVQNALKTLSKIPGIDNEPASSPSPTPTPTPVSS